MTRVVLGPAGKLAQAFINSKLTPLVIVASILLGVGAVPGAVAAPVLAVDDGRADRLLGAPVGRLHARGV